MLESENKEIGFVKISKNYQNLKFLINHHKKIDQKDILNPKINLIKKTQKKIPLLKKRKKINRKILNKLGKKIQYPEMEKYLKNWVLKQAFLTGYFPDKNNIIKEALSYFSKNKESSRFLASRGWLFKFLRRNFKKIKILL